MLSQSGIIVIQAALDLVLILIIIYLLFFKSHQKEKQLQEQREKLKELVVESDRSADAFKESLAADIEKFRILIRSQEQKEKQLRQVIGETEELLRQVKRERLSTSQADAQDPYHKVRALAKTGMSAEEISRNTELSTHEVKLILDIYK